MFKHRIFTFLLKKMFDENMFWNIFHQTPSNTNFSSFLKNVKILYIHKPFKHFIKHQKLTMFDEMFERFAPAFILYCCTDGVFYVSVPLKFYLLMEYYVCIPLGFYSRIKSYVDAPLGFHSLLNLTSIVIWDFIYSNL